MTFLYDMIILSTSFTALPRLQVFAHFALSCNEVDFPPTCHPINLENDDWGKTLTCTLRI